MTNKNQLIEMAMGYFRSRVLVAAARLELADALQAGPKTAIALAKESHADPDAMHRLLRALASFGVVAETVPGTNAPGGFYPAGITTQDPERKAGSAGVGGAAMDL